MLHIVDAPYTNEGSQRLMNCVIASCLYRVILIAEVSGICIYIRHQVEDFKCKNSFDPKNQFGKVHSHSHFTEDEGKA